MQANSDTTSHNGYGCFEYADMHLALPIEALREVIPKTQIEPLPVQAEYIIGGVNLRNAMVPIIDLAILFNKTPNTQSNQCVFIIRHNDQVIGIKADRLDGLFFINQKNLSPYSNVNQENSKFMLASLKHPDKGSLYNLLNIQELFSLNNLAAAKENEIFKDSNAFEIESSLSDTAAENNEDETVHLILMRTGLIEIAVDTIEIETTIAHPKIQPTAMAKDYFKGTIDFQSMDIPAIDLCKLLQLDTDAVPTECFIIRTEHGPLALLIQNILEIIHISTDKLSTLPKIGFKKPHFLKSTLDNDNIPKAIKEKLKPRGFHHLVLDAANISKDSELLDLTKTYCQKNITDRPSQTNKNQDIEPFQVNSATSEVQEGDVSKTVEDTGLISTNSHNDDEMTLITFMTKRELSCPVEQVLEVLPFDARLQKNTPDEFISGILTNRARSIPIVDLTQMIEGSPGQNSNQSSILLIQVESELVGFIVSKLNSIEYARKIPPIPLLDVRERPQYNPLQTTQNMAEITKNNKRILPVLDLISCAKFILSKEIV